MGGILAAGNRVLIKPSEFTPATAAVLQQLIGKYFDASEIAVVTGDAAFAAAFSALPFDHLLFTGSTSVARHIASAAAPNLTPLTLELGGKSPVVVGDTADLDVVAKKVLFAKTMNAGQICLAPDYLVIRADRRDQLVDAIKRAAQAMYPQGAASADYVNIINTRHAARLRGYLDDAQQRGNRVIPLFPEKNNSVDARCLPPHLVLIDGDGGSILGDEIFGPLLPIVAVPSFTEIPAVIARHSRPLALYYFGHDRHEIATLTNTVACGGMVVNDLLVHFLQDDLPFGGVGDSGMGSYHGREGFLRFSHAKAVFTQARPDIGALLRPPYGKRFRRLLDMQIGH
jgi:coniferyl-aldehyde dehydrogenase